MSVQNTAWKVSKYEVFRTFLYSVRIQENADRKKLHIWSLFMQWKKNGDPYKITFLLEKIDYVYNWPIPKGTLKCLQKTFH